MNEAITHEEYSNLSIEDKFKAVFGEEEFSSMPIKGTPQGQTSSYLGYDPSAYHQQYHPITLEGSNDVNQNPAKSVITAENMLVCRVCNIKFSYLDELNHHLTMHIEENVAQPEAEMIWIDLPPEGKLNKN